MRSSIDDGNFDMYLKDIRETPLLTAEEERDLALRVQKGDKEARDRMIRANLRLVIAEAKKFLHRGLSFMDLIAEGNIGLMRAVEKFNFEEHPNRFSTYGIHWIKQAIRRALLNCGKTVRVPSYMVEWISRFKQRATEITRQTGQTPDVTVVALELGFNAEQAEMMRRAMNAGTQTSDISAPDGESSLTEMIPDERSTDPGEEVSLRAEISKLGRVLDQIEPREAEVLRLRYGIGTDRPLTLSEIGEQINLTRERVRQIENEALHKLHTIMAGGASSLRLGLDEDEAPRPKPRKQKRLRNRPLIKAAPEKVEQPAEAAPAADALASNAPPAPVERPAEGG